MVRLPPGIPNVIGMDGDDSDGDAVTLENALAVEAMFSGSPLYVFFYHGIFIFLKIG